MSYITKALELFTTIKNSTDKKAEIVIIVLLIVDVVVQYLN